MGRTRFSGRERRESAISVLNSGACRIREGSDKDGAIHESVGNVRTDLGLPNGREGMLKVEIASAISATIRGKNLTQAAAGKIIGADQGKVSELLRGRLTG